MNANEPRNEMGSIGNQHSRDYIQSWFREVIGGFWDEGALFAFRDFCVGGLEGF